MRLFKSIQLMLIHLWKWKLCIVEIRVSKGRDISQDVPWQFGMGRPIVFLSRDKTVSLSHCPFVTGQEQQKKSRDELLCPRIRFLIICNAKMHSNFWTKFENYCHSVRRESLKSTLLAAGPGFVLPYYTRVPRAEEFFAVAVEQFFCMSLSSIC